MNKRPFSRRINAYIGLFMLTALLILQSCSSYYFENPQPAGLENLQSFPKKITGTYLDPEKGDTIGTIFSDGISLEVNKNNVKLPLNEKFILRKYKSYYFLNLKQEQDQLWAVYILKPGPKKSLDIYAISSDAADINILKGITEVKTKENKGEDNDIYILNPSYEEMLKIFDSGLLKSVQKMKK
ncbi:MAG: hypothetical protein H6540_01860 [Bacteroidales bacterium]|nr:hypothetical protein [Bacteroidales bacterium]MCB9013911.1 hypothetical protein [Bacteroidales bacterium]